MPVPEITLDDNHVYRVEGEIWPGVNQVLTDTGLMRPYLGDPWYGDRGTAVHSACHMLDQGILDDSSIDPQIAGYIDAYSLYRMESGMEFAHAEERLRHPIYRYCGTPDRWSPLLDLKTGDSHEPLTLELYAELIRVNGGIVPPTAYFLRLKDDGTYSLKPYKLNATARSIALSAVVIWHERKKRGTL